MNLGRALGALFRAGADGAHADPLARFRAGDAAAFDEIVHAYAPSLVRRFRRQGVDPSTADDLAQEVFVRLIKTHSSYESRGRLQVYLYRIARNVLLDWRRARSARPSRSLESAASQAGAPPLAVLAHPAVGPPEILAGRDAARALTSLLRRLSEGERAVLELSIFDGMPYAEIAHALQIPEGTVKSRVFNALRKLRNMAGDTVLDGRSAFDGTNAFDGTSAFDGSTAAGEDGTP